MSHRIHLEDEATAPPPTLAIKIDPVTTAVALESPSSITEHLVPYWKVFPGKRRFFCNGACHTSKTWLVVPGVLSMILVPATLHLGFDIPFLGQYANPVVPIVGFLLMCLSVSTYVMCAFSDPGYMPRASPAESVHTENANGITVDLAGQYYPAPKNKTLGSY
jgi:hypothetical protein